VHDQRPNDSNDPAGRGERLLLRIEEAADRLSLSRATVVRLLASGQLASVKIGSARRIPVAALEQLVAHATDRGELPVGDPR
jgi:excisionase family DNA binding protein